MDPTLPLSEAWRDLLHAVADEHRLARDPASLARALGELSRVYNGLDAAGTARGRSALAARLAFSFVRDVPKAAFAVRELVGLGLLRIPDDRPLAMIDVGAGLGAMTFGVAAALANAGQRGELQSAWIDVDDEATSIGASIARHARRVGEVSIDPKRSTAPKGGADLVVLGQVLSEMDTSLDEEARAERHEALVREWLSRVSEGGSLVVVEPALRDRTRHLHRIRDRLVRGGVRPFAPCLHAEPCPALMHATDWCHEDRDLDLPAWLVPLARAAGLRWQGLTFSYLVIRKDGASLARALAPRGLVRVISRPLVSKGKTELVLCGEVMRDGEARGGSARAAVLDREREGRAAWDAAGRGDLLVIDPPIPEGTSRIRLERTRVGSIDAKDSGR